VREPPSEIDPQETIGRQLFSSNHYSRKSRKVKYRAFYWPGHSSLSVDRLDHGPPGFLKDLGQRSAEARESNFHGWAKLTAAKASRGGREVEADPLVGDKADAGLGENRYHAHIHLSADATNDAQRKEEAIALARLSRWVPPNWHPRGGLA